MYSRPLGYSACNRQSWIRTLTLKTSQTSPVSTAFNLSTQNFQASLLTICCIKDEPHENSAVGDEVSAAAQRHSNMIFHHGELENESEEDNDEGASEDEGLNEEVEAEMQDFGYLWGNGADYGNGEDGEPENEDENRVIETQADGVDRDEDPEHEFDDVSSEDEDEENIDLGFEQF